MTTDLNKILTDLEATARANGNLVGCSDGNCVIKKPTGMHTNGGCHCLDGLRSDKRLQVRRLLLIRPQTALALIELVRLYRELLDQGPYGIQAHTKEAKILERIWK